MISFADNNRSRNRADGFEPTARIRIEPTAFFCKKKAVGFFLPKFQVHFLEFSRKRKHSAKFRQIFVEISRKNRKICSLLRNFGSWRWILQNFWKNCAKSGMPAKKCCRSRKMLQNEYLLFSCKNRLRYSRERASTDPFIFIQLTPSTHQRMIAWARPGLTSEETKVASAPVDPASPAWDRGDEDDIMHFCASSADRHSRLSRQWRYCDTQ